MTEVTGPASPRTTRALLVVLGIFGLVAIVVGMGIAFGPRDNSTSSPTRSSVPTPTASTPSPVETSARPTPVPAPLGTQFEVAPGVSAMIGDLAAVDGVAVNPGEIAGPAVRVPVSIRNDTASEISLSSLVVSADYGEARTPASELSGPGAAPLATTVAAGSSAEGIYIFVIPTDQRNLVRIGVDYASEVAPILFEGSAPS